VAHGWTPPKRYEVINPATEELVLRPHRRKGRPSVSVQSPETWTLTPPGLSQRRGKYAALAADYEPVARLPTARNSCGQGAARSGGPDGGVTGPPPAAFDRSALGLCQSWSDLLERYGPWQTVHTCIRRYALTGCVHPCTAADPGPCGRCRRHRLAGPARSPTRRHRPNEGDTPVGRTGRSRPRCRPDQVVADQACSSPGFRAYRRRRGSAHTVPGKSDQQRH
jgi:hypothetical protein